MGIHSTALIVIISIVMGLLAGDDKFEMEMAKGLRSQVTEPNRSNHIPVTD
jgi:hypothetical protein